MLSALFHWLTARTCELIELELWTLDLNDTMSHPILTRPRTMNTISRILAARICTAGFPA